STEPPRTSSAIGRSAAGSACAREPPMVPRCLICGSPTSEAAWARSGASVLTRSDDARSACLVVAPTTISSPSTLTPAPPHAAPRVPGRARGAGDVDEARGRGEPQLHHREQRVTAGQHLGVIAVLAEQVDRVSGRAGCYVLELSWNHAVTSAWAVAGSAAAFAAARTARMMFW